MYYRKIALIYMLNCRPLSQIILIKMYYSFYILKKNEIFVGTKEHFRNLQYIMSDNKI